VLPVERDDAALGFESRRQAGMVEQHHPRDEGAQRALVQHSRRRPVTPGQWPEGEEVDPRASQIDLGTHHLDAELLALRMRDDVHASTVTRGGTMSRAREMLEAHPRALSIEVGVLAACIDECFVCASTCTACADADLGEPDVDTLLRCITLCVNCGDVCVATGRVLSRQTEFVAELARVALEACIEACRRCREECERHAQHHEHCRICAEECRRCEQACAAALSALPT
jgi:hypothetical protein